MKKYNCEKCNLLIEEDDVVWADEDGDTDVHTLAWCVSCLPAEPYDYD